MKESGRRCSSVHMAALLLEIFQGLGLMLTFCFASPGYGLSLLDPRWLTTTFTMKTARVRKRREKGHMPPLKDMTQNCTHDFHSCPIGQALLTWSHLLTREVGKSHLYLRYHVPGFCLWERENGSGYRRTTNSHDEQVGLKLLESRSWSCGNAKKGVCLGLRGEPRR